MYVRTLGDQTMPAARTRPARTRRINLRATDRQEKLIRTGAEMKGVSVTDFILDSACLQAEQALADKREVVVNTKQWREFTAALDRPARFKPELARLFAEVAGAHRKTKR
jgi:uncharacterized protein (DUF1778 family)